MLYHPEQDHRRELAERNAEGGWRDEFMRDYGRVIHSASFRRLQGKTQVFPGYESDFFRNRLTHSLEVAQIAEGIADRLNACEPFLKDNAMRLDGRLCATAGLLHDLGHPPFGHNGERALDAKMRPHGGFEGNAQSLRIVSRLEKKAVGADGRPYGLNLTFRTLAAILKYDRAISGKREGSAALEKGYYESEAGLVADLRSAVAGRSPPAGAFKTVECSLMDLADDIAYSTFDLEDALKARFLTPSDILASVASDRDLIERVAAKVTKELRDKSVGEVTAKDVARELQEVFEYLIVAPEAGGFEGSRLNATERFMRLLASGQAASNELADSSHLRTKLSSDLVKRAINAATLVPDEVSPALSRVKLSDDALRRVEVLKQYVFLATVSSPRVKMQEYRGTIVVTEIFEALAGDKGSVLLPEDVRRRHDSAGPTDDRMRVICDFIAGMTDRYAAEFHARLHSVEAVSMFKQY